MVLKAGINNGMVETLVRPRKYLALAMVFIQDKKKRQLCYLLCYMFQSVAFIQLCYSFYTYRKDMDSLAVILHHWTLLVNILIVNAHRYLLADVLDRLLTEMCDAFDYGGFLVKERQEIQTGKEGRINFIMNIIYASTVYTQVNLFIFSLTEMYMLEKDVLLIYPCWFPFELSSFFSKAVAFIWEHIVIESLGIEIFGELSVLFIAYMHLSSELRILELSFANFKERAEFLVENGEIETIEEALIYCSRECSKHHVQVISYFDAAQSYFRLSYMLFMVTGMVVMTVTGIALLSDNTSLKVKFVSVLVTQVVYLYIVCWFAESISQKGDLLRDTVYRSDLISMPKPCITNFRFIMLRTMKELRFKAMSGQSASLEVYMDMMKASYSYFNMIFAAQEKH